MIAPATSETRGEAAEFDARHPDLRIRRYVATSYHLDWSVPPGAEFWRRHASRIRYHSTRAVGEERPDIVLGGRDFVAVALRGVGRRNRLPWVIRSGGYPLKMLSDGAYPRSLASRMIRALRAAQTLIVQAEHLRALAISLGCPRVVVVPNLVDAERFRPQPKPAWLAERLGLAPDALVVLHPSNLKPIKRVEDLLRSAVEVTARVSRAIYLIVGDGPNRDLLEQRRRALGLGDRVRFTGWLAYDRMPAFMALADVVVMPSAYEQQARVYLEAQAASRCLVASDICAAREVVADGESGLLHRLGDVGELSSRTIQALADADLREAIGRRARKRILERHALDVVARSFSETLVSAAQGSSAMIA